MELIFQFLCGLLYLVGLPFGWSYQETSIYVCIYLWPMLCTLSTIPILWISVKRRKWILSVVSLLYTSVYVYFTIDVINHYPISNPASFMNCMTDLKSLAAYCGVTYAEINLLIYVVAFILILLFNFSVYMIIQKKYANNNLKSGGTL